MPTPSALGPSRPARWYESAEVPPRLRPLPAALEPAGDAAGADREPGRQAGDRPPAGPRPERLGRGDLGAGRRPPPGTGAKLGFGPRFIDSFFRPSSAGLSGDRLATSSRMLEFVFRMFSQGRAALPAAPRARSPSSSPDGSRRETLRTERGRADRRGRVVLVRGERVAAAAVVIATEAPEAARLLPHPSPPAPSTACFYAAAEAPIPGRCWS